MPYRDRREKSDYNKKYYALHKEALNLHSKNYGVTHKNEISNNKKKYWKTKREELRKKNRIHYLRRRDERLRKQKIYAEKTKEHKKEYDKRYRQENKNKRSHWANRRRIAKANAGGAHTMGEWENLKAQYNWTCPACKKPSRNTELTRDHIIPIVKGGSDNIENIQPLCRSCNCKKHTEIKKYDY